MTIQQIEEMLEECGVRYEIRNDCALVEFWTDTAGQDIPVELDYDGTPEDFIQKFVEYADNYDVDEEVELYVNMRGKNGVPNTVRELLDDCQEAKDTLMYIAEKLKKLERDTYMCDGKSSSCLGEIPYDDVNWFTSSLGFCEHCWGRLHRAPQKILDYCYDECEAGDDEVAEFVIGLTE